MTYWLIKSEPNAYSLADLQRDHKTAWHGVRNYQARNMLRDQMQVGELAFFYHSNTKVCGIVGIAEICRTGYPDISAFDPADKYFDPSSTPAEPRWFVVDVQFKQKFAHIISLQALRANADLASLLILRKGNRLSITPLTPTEWQTILQQATE